MSRILVTGGAGYIGSHIVAHLVALGRDVVVVDDLSAGHRAAVRDAALIEGDFGDPEVLDGIMAGGDVDAVIHLAAFAEVGESMRDPASYYHNNLGRSLVLLDAMQRHGVAKFVLSSTCAVYGTPRDVPLTENHPTAPVNPYGETKLAVERALHWFHHAYGLQYVALRYFNAAGANADGTIGEDHRPESHLIPRLIGGVLRPGEATPIFGTDYPTSDGTCVRDYVHVMDLARAHILALDRMALKTDVAEAFNLGNGEGFSVLEVVGAIERVTGTRPQTVEAPRREGDPAILVAGSSRARQQLGWRPESPGIERIVETAWNWHRNNPDGFESS